jgi:hypothetical protein
MSGVSWRFVPHVAILAILVAIPSLLHSRGTYLYSDCDHPELLRPLLRQPYMDDVIEADRRHANLERAAGEHGDWVEGSWLADNGLRVHWHMVRSFDPKGIYHRPQRQLLEGGSLQDVRVAAVEVDGQSIPVHWNDYEYGLSRERERVYAAFLLVYGGRAVAHPILRHLSTAPIQLVRGRWPMTRYFAFVRTEPSREEEARAAVDEWLAQQWRNYSLVCVERRDPAT